MQSDIKETTRAREFIIIKEHDPNWSLRSFCQLAWPCRCKQSTLVVSSVERDNATVFPLSSMTTNTFSLFRTRHGEEQHGRTFEKREEARVQNPKRACMALQLPIGDLIISIFSTAISVSSTVQHCFPTKASFISPIQEVYAATLCYICNKVTPSVFKWKSNHDI